MLIRLVSECLFRFHSCERLLDFPSVLLCKVAGASVGQHFTEELRNGRDSIPYVIADFVNTTFCFLIQLIDEISELWNLFSNTPIAVRLGSRRDHL